MPEMKDRDAWWSFLSGRPESEWNAPKKPKKQNKRDQRYGSYGGDGGGGGMRSFLSEYEVQYTPASQLPYAYASEEGEVERAIATTDAADALPTPSATPGPADRTLQTDPDGTSTEASSSLAAGASVLPPEPTPLLLRNMDHVRTPSSSPVITHRSCGAPASGIRCIF